MSNLDKAKQALAELGLSEKQAEVYLLLVSRQELRIQEIAELSHLPRSSVYETVRHLQELGLVEEVVDENFKRLVAHPPSILRHVLDEQMGDLQRQLDSLDELEHLVSVTAGSGTNPTTVRYYKGRTGARQVYWNSLKATNTVYVYSEWGRQQSVGLQYYAKFVAETHRRGIKEKVLINLTPQILETIRAYTIPGSPLYRTKLADIRVAPVGDIHIQGDTLLYNDIYAQVYLKNVGIHGFEIQGQSFTQTQRSIFETFWRSAKPVAELL